METDDVHADDNESNGQAAIGTFTVEARVEGIGEDYAEALAVRLAAMKAELARLDIIPEQGSD